MRAQLLEAEAAHYSKTKGSTGNGGTAQSVASSATSRRQLENTPGQEGDLDEEPDAKRRRILEETRDIDADSDGSGSESSEEERFDISTNTSEDND